MKDNVVMLVHDTLSRDYTPTYQISCLRTEDNDAPTIITPPHMLVTDGQQRQPNHNTTTYYVY